MTAIVIATSTTAVPRSAIATASAIPLMITAIGRSVCFSFTEPSRPHKKNARNSASAGFASSEGCSEKGPACSQRWLELSVTYTATSSSSTTPKPAKANFGSFQRR